MHAHVETKTLAELSHISPLLNVGTGMLSVAVSLALCCVIKLVSLQWLSYSANTRPPLEMHPARVTSLWQTGTLAALQ